MKLGTDQVLEMSSKMDNQHSEQETAVQRDQLLRRLLKTPPQPRPKRERGKTKTAIKAAKQKGGSRRPSTDA